MGECLYLRGVHVLVCACVCACVLVCMCVIDKACDWIWVSQLIVVIEWALSMGECERLYLRDVHVLVCVSVCLCACV